MRLLKKLIIANEIKEIRDINLKKNTDYHKAYAYDEEQSFLWNTLYESLLTFSKKGEQNKAVSEKIKKICHNYGANGVENPQSVFNDLDQNWFKAIYAKGGIDHLNESHVDWMTIDECIKQIDWEKANRNSKAIL